MNRRVHMIVSGRVQGVCFRMNASMEARRIGASGWVRNLPDGTVELEVEGSADAVGEMIRWCRRGPAMSQVMQVAVTDQAPINDRKAFRIL
jgi:acylphosphatase